MNLVNTYLLERTITTETLILNALNVHKLYYRGDTKYAGDDDQLRFY